MTQDQAFSILKTGANVFLTGEPGAGKTFVVNRYVSYLREHDIEPAITASTGIAATHIGGMTIHSWSGIGIKKILSEEDLDKISTNERLVKRVSRAQVLIIDEISMLDALTLTAVDASLRALRRSEEPFGGLQVVLVGDFFQLPPISRYGETASQFAFASDAWQNLKPLICYLSEQHRQDDGPFLSFLSAVRSGELSDDTHEILESRMTDTIPEETHTRLYSHNANVDMLNTEKLSSIDGVVHTFRMESRGSDGLVATLKKGCLSPEILELKVGAQVMCTKNSFEQGFANGTLGVVESFSPAGNPVMRTRSGEEIEIIPLEWNITDGGKTLATISQIPLRLAWAITVHKSQGMTLDAAVVDLSQAFEYGQGYVALSRVRTLAGLYLVGYNARALQVHPEILEIDQSFKDTSEKAEIAFGNIAPAEQQTMEDNFVRACGGSVKKVSIKKVGKKLGKKEKGVSTYDKTLAFVIEGRSIEEIANQRDITVGTVISHLEELFMKGRLSHGEVQALIPPELAPKLPAIIKLFETLGTDKLAPVFEKSAGKYAYEDLRLVRLFLNSDKN